MALQDFVQFARNMSLSDAEVATAYNTSPDRYVSTERTARQLIQAFGTDVADAVLGELTDLAAQKPSVGLVLKTLESGAPIDLGDPVTRSVIQATQLSDEIKGQLLMLADPNGGDATPGQVGRIRRQVRALQEGRQIRLDQAYAAARDEVEVGSDDAKVLSVFTRTFEGEL